MVSQKERMKRKESGEEGDKEEQEHVSYKGWKRNLLHDDERGKGVGAGGEKEKEEWVFRRWKTCKTLAYNYRNK